MSRAHFWACWSYLLLCCSLAGSWNIGFCSQTCVPARPGGQRELGRDNRVSVVLWTMLSCHPRSHSRRQSGISPTTLTWARADLQLQTVAASANAVLSQAQAQSAAAHQQPHAPQWNVRRRVYAVSLAVGR